MSFYNLPWSVYNPILLQLGPWVSTSVPMTSRWTPYNFWNKHWIFGKQKLFFTQLSRYDNPKSQLGLGLHTHPVTFSRAPLGFCENGRCPSRLRNTSHTEDGLSHRFLPSAPDCCSLTGGKERIRENESPQAALIIGLCQANVSWKCSSL